MGKINDVFYEITSIFFHCFFIGHSKTDLKAYFGNQLQLFFFVNINVYICIQNFAPTFCQFQTSLYGFECAAESKERIGII